MTPEVTIIMATYNRAHFILETLVSIQNQTFLNWECIIIDDGGTDNTLEAIRPILVLDQRFQFLKRTKSYKKGLPGCRNYGIDLAKGNYIIFFDDDDFVHPDNLKTCLETIETYNVDFCHYQKLAYSDEKPPIESKPIAFQQYLAKADIEKVITQQIGLASCTVMWNKHCFENCRFNESLLYAEEWECYNRIISENFKGIIISNVLYYNRKHTYSNTGEFYKNNNIFKDSFAKAVILIIQNLNKKNLLSNNLKRFFITISINYKEFNLFIFILNSLELSTFEKLKWQLFYFTLPLRIFFFGKWKKINKR